MTRSRARRHSLRHDSAGDVLVHKIAVDQIGQHRVCLVPAHAPRHFDYPGEFGGCSLPASIVAANPRLACHQFGFNDTLAHFGGLWSFGSNAMAHVSNQFAAMPSLHIGWSTWCAIVVAPRARRRWVKALVTLNPFATLFCILITANHYWLDAVGGLVTLGVGTLLGWQFALAVHRWADRRDAKRARSVEAEPTE